MPLLQWQPQLSPWWAAQQQQQMAMAQQAAALQQAWQALQPPPPQQLLYLGPPPAAAPPPPQQQQQHGWQAPAQAAAPPLVRRPLFSARPSPRPAPAASGEDVVGSPGAAAAAEAYRSQLAALEARLAEMRSRCERAPATPRALRVL
jgi:hypothetical protein